MIIDRIKKGEDRRLRKEHAGLRPGRETTKNYYPEQHSRAGK